MINPQLLGPHFRGASLASAEEGERQAVLLQQFDAESITYIKAFLQLPIGTEPEATVGEHSIHIQHQELQSCQSRSELPLLPSPPQRCHARPA